MDFHQVSGNHMNLGHQRGLRWLVAQATYIDIASSGNPETMDTNMASFGSTDYGHLLGLQWQPKPWTIHMYLRPQQGQG